MLEAPEPAPRPAPQNWRSGEGRSARSRGNGTRLVLLSALFLAMLGMGMAWVLYPNLMAAPEFFSLAVREYADPRLPPNPLAVQDGTLLLERFAGASEQGADNNRYNYQSRDQLDKVLQGLRQRSDGAVVVHLCALARAEPDPARPNESRVFLLPGDAGLHDRARWLRLRTVLDVLRDSPSPHKLLLLDVMRPGADARLGVLADDVADHVHAELKQAAAEKPLPFFVLCACGPGQVSHVADGLRRSAFAHALDQGLRGRADGHGDTGRPDLRVTVTELASYVRANVDPWARQVRGARQTPVLYGDPANDFPLVQLDGDPPAAPPPPEPMAYPAWLLAGWQRRDQWKQDGTFRTHPHRYRQMEAALLRAERRWRGGLEEDRLKTELTRDLAKWAEQAAPGKAPSPTPLSLAAAVAAAPLDAKAQAELGDVQAALRTVLLRAADDPAGGEEDKARQERLAKAQQELLPRLQKHPFPHAAARVLDVTASFQKLTPGMLRFSHQLVRSLPTSVTTTKTRYVETIYLERLKDFLDKTVEYGWPWPAEDVAQALKTALTAEALYADLRDEPAAVPWVAPLLNTAEEKRLAAERQFFATETRATWKDGRRDLAQAEQLYQTAATRVALLRRARQQLEEAVAVLPGWADFLAAEDRPEPDEEFAWKGAVEATRELRDFLSRPAPERLAYGEPEALGRLRGQLAVLHGALARKTEQALRNAPNGDAATGRALHALLDCPLLDAAKRQVVWKGSQELEARLHASVAGEETARSTPRAPAGDDAAARAESERRQRRAWLALALLRLADESQLAGLQKKYDAADRQADPAAWHLLAKELAQAWTVDLPERLAQPGTGARTREAIGWVLPWPAGPPSANPTEALRQEALARYAAQLSQRYQNEARALAAQRGPHAAFYAAAAEAVTHAARP